MMQVNSKPFCKFVAPKFLDHPKKSAYLFSIDRHIINFTRRSEKTVLKYCDKGSQKNKLYFLDVEMPDWVTL